MCAPFLLLYHTAHFTHCVTCYVTPAELFISLMEKNTNIWEPIAFVCDLATTVFEKKEIAAWKGLKQETD